MRKKLVSAATASLLLAMAASIAGSAAWASDRAATGSILANGEVVTTLPAGATFTARVTQPPVDASFDDWCSLQPGASREGLTMAIRFMTGSTPVFSIPSSGGQPGAGPVFTWKNGDGDNPYSVDVNVTLPADIADGEYTVKFSCLDGEGMPLGLGVTPFTFTIGTADPDGGTEDNSGTANRETLAQTGTDVTNQFGLAGAALLLVTSGIGVYALRRRVTAKR